MNRKNSTPVFHKAFTLVELLVVISIISLLMSILVTSINSSRSQAKEIVCKNNLRQLALANENYANDHHNYSVPGASDILSDNLHRWYGIRENTDLPFDPLKGPLSPYLQGCVAECPQNVKYTSIAPNTSDYEFGNGGYGYNLAYLGSQIWQVGYEDHSCKESTKITNIKRPQETLLFADTAMAKWVEGNVCLIMYAFAEPRHFVIGHKPEETWNPYPSLHFRHRKTANIAWADSHITDKKIGRYDGLNNDGTRSSDFNVGWFEPMDNSLFDIE